MSTSNTPQQYNIGTLQKTIKKIQHFFLIIRKRFHNPNYWVLPSIGFVLAGMFLIRGQCFNSQQTKELGSKA